MLQKSQQFKGFKSHFQTKPSPPQTSVNISYKTYISVVSEKIVMSVRTYLRLNKRLYSTCQSLLTGLIQTKSSIKDKKVNINRFQCCTVVLNDKTLGLKAEALRAILLGHFTITNLLCESAWWNVPLQFLCVFPLKEGYFVLHKIKTSNVTFTRLEEHADILERYA